MKVLLSLFFLSLTLQLASQEVIQEIEIIPIPKSFQINKKEILDKLSIKKGDIFSEEAISKSIKFLYKNLGFSKVVTEYKEIGKNKKIIFKVEEPYTIEKISISGNSAIPLKELKEELKIFKGEKFKDSNLLESKNNIVELYKNKGFLDINVKIKKEFKNKQISISLTLLEGEKLNVKNIIIQGNKKFTQKEVLKTLDLKIGFFSKIFNLDNFLNKKKIEKNFPELRKLYNNHGYFDFNIKSYNFKSIKGSKEEKELIINLQEGQQYKVQSFSIIGSKKLKEKVTPLVTLKKNSAYNEDKLKKILNNIKNLYYKEGFIDCSVGHKVTKNKKDKSTHINIVINEYKSYKIRDIYIRGNTVTKDSVIRREIVFYPHEVLNKNKLDLSARRLQNLRFFKTVNITPFSTNDPNLKDIEISLLEDNTGSLSFALGISSNSGAFFDLSVKENNFDLFNLSKGAGQKLSLQARFGNRRNHIELSFTEPYFGGKKLSLSTSAYRREYIYSRYNQKNSGLSLSLSNRLQKNKRWIFRRGLVFEEIEIFDFNSNASDELKKEETKEWANQVFTSLRYDTRNSYFNPTKGKIFSLGAQLQTKFLAAESDILSLSFKFVNYKKISSDNTFKFLTQFRIAESLDKKKDNPVPIYRRFFSGGLFSVRGVRYRDISPFDPDDKDALGGESLFTSTLELKTDLNKDISFVSFIDAGNVWEKSTDLFDFNGITVTVGVGLIINTPIAPIHFVYGFVIERGNLTHDKNDEFHFNIGRSF